MHSITDTKGMGFNALILLGEMPLRSFSKSLTVPANLRYDLKLIK
jgi:hypothetical protein